MTGLNLKYGGLTKDYLDCFGEFQSDLGDTKLSGIPGPRQVLQGPSALASRRVSEECIRLAGV